MISPWNNYLSINSSIASMNCQQIGDLLDELSAKLIATSLSSKSIIFTAGNGGSATTADHFAADLSLTKRRIGKRIRSICLNSHIGLNTALSNDIAYKDALSMQLDNFLDSSHILVVFSASGNSPNIVNLLNAAVSSGVECWAFLGFDGGLISHMQGIRCIIFPDISRDYGVAENVHLMACHYVISQIVAGNSLSSS